MVLPSRRATAWLLSACVGMACAGSDDSSEGFASLGSPGVDSMGPTGGQDDTETGPSGADWMDVDESSGGSTSNGDGAPADSSGGASGDATGDDATTTATQTTDDGPAGSPFQGDYAGTASGSCNFVGNVSGDWTITVSPDGTFAGSIDVSSGIGNLGLDGTVSDEGEVVTNDGDCGFLGQIEDDGSSAGDFTCDGGCSGSWSGGAV